LRIRHVLRLGTADLLFLAQAPHAAVHEAVRLAEPIAHGRFKGLVNAVLRRVAREGRTRIAEDDAPLLNTPPWLFETWRASYGDETAHRIAAAHLEEPPLDLTPAHDGEVLAQRLAATLLPTGTVRLRNGGPVAELPGYAEGLWWVQDVAAALPARLLGEVRERRVLDLCAAPGGKTAQLAAAGALVTAVDISANRLRLLRENLARLDLRAEIVTADAALWRPTQPADAVLLDAPCSATGTIRRHPDLPWQRRPDSLGALIPLQARLLAAAAEAVAPGGRLVYSVCSLQPEEGAAAVARLLAERSELSREPISAVEVGGLGELLTPRGEVRSLPCHMAELGGMDGFYIARLRRR
jgi:16S rRNA (cytosine967-C5)-methyltransferase